MCEYKGIAGEIKEYLIIHWVEKSGKIGVGRS